MRQQIVKHLIKSNMKPIRLFLGLVLALFCTLPIFAYTVSNSMDSSIKSKVATPRAASVFVNDNGAIYPVYVPNLSENTTIQEVWNATAPMLSTNFF